MGVAYNVRSNKLRNYKRSVVINGTLVRIEVDGKEGIITSDNELDEATLSRLEDFYNVIRTDSTPEVDEHEETENAEEVEEQSEEQSTEEQADDEDEADGEDESEGTEPEPEPEASVEVSDTVVKDTKETSDGFLTVQEVSNLYEELGTWTAVADRLGIATSTLRKYREELDLV